jgi:hypothetical protein
MPSKVLKFLEFVGFSGNRSQGFAELEQSTQLTEGLRCPLAVLIMLCYQSYIEHIFGEISKNLHNYRTLSVYFLIFFTNESKRNVLID